METEPQHASPEAAAAPPPPEATPAPEAPEAPIEAETAAASEAAPPPAEAAPMHEVPVLPFVELPPEAAAAPKRSLLRRFVDAVPWLPVLTVVVPTAVSATYYGIIASDVYISESHFVVRSPQRQAPSGLSALLTTGSFSRSQDDTYTVHDFMRSRDAMQRIDASTPLRELFGSRKFDFVARFDGLGLDGSAEALFKFYQKVVVVDFDTTTGISMLRVHGFTSEDAASINERLLQMGEALVNELSERGRKDMIRFAESEVERAEEKARAAAAALSAYRNENAVFDPERQGAMQLQGLAKLQDELIATTVQITQVRTLSPDNPQLPALEKRLASIQGAIGAEMAKVAGGQSSLSKKAADFERLSMDRVFAEKQLATALSALEQARAEAQRKQLYLERIAQPSRPDIGLEPRRARSVLATLLVGLLSWGILAMLIAGVREHRD